MQNIPPSSDDADTLPRTRSVAPPRFADVMTPIATGSQTNPLFVVAVLVAAVAIVIGVGVVILGRSGDPALTSAQSALDIVQRAEQAHLQDAAFSISNVQTIIVGNAGSGATTLTTTTNGHGTLTHSPQRLHLLFDQTGDPSLQFTSDEIILDGSDAYVRLPTGLYPNLKQPWLKLSGAQSAEINGLSGVDTTDVTDYAQLTDVQLLGQTTIAGKKAWHLQGTVPGSAPVSVNGVMLATTQTEEIWLQQTTYLPLKLTLHQTNELNVTSSTSGSSSLGTVTDLTYAFTAWNTGATIALPPASQVTTTLPTTSFGTPTPTPGTPQPHPTQIVPTATPVPAPTPVRTATPMPTFTPLPMATPTRTPTQTPTPSPTP